MINSETDPLCSPLRYNYKTDLNWTSNDPSVSESELFLAATYNVSEIIKRVYIRFFKANPVNNLLLIVRILWCESDPKCSRTMICRPMKSLTFHMTIRLFRSRDIGGLVDVTLFILPRISGISESITPRPSSMRMSRYISTLLDNTWTSLAGWDTSCTQGKRCRASSAFMTSGKKFI